LDGTLFEKQALSPLLSSLYAVVLQLGCHAANRATSRRVPNVQANQATLLWKDSGREGPCPIVILRAGMATEQHQCHQNELMLTR